MDQTVQKKRVIALGFFDGVHLGHGALLCRTAEVAQELGVTAAALTFDCPPSRLMKGETSLITAPVDRAYLMRTCYHMEDVLIIPFDDHIQTMPWETFITDFLVKEHGAVHLVAGHDFHFGYKGEGNPQRLQETCQKIGIGCDIIPAVEQEHITISSSYIRILLAEGDMERTNQFLGHPHTLSSTVAHGKGLGKKLGFPTVNLTLHPDLLVPAYGVYATLVTLEDGSVHQAVTNLGVRPTVDSDNQVNVEAFLLDFDGDLYGQEVRIHFYKYLRGEQKFPTFEALTAEVMRNAQQTRDYFDRR